MTSSTYPLSTIALLLTSLVTITCAWGPVYHAYTSCGVFPGANLEACFCDGENKEMVLGSYLPDAFYFGDTISGSTCVGLAQLHDIVFAGCQYKYADKLSNVSSSKFTDFATGYAFHILADAPAFFAPNAYLGSKLPYWLRAWPFMNAIDATVTEKLSPTPCVNISTNMDEDLVNFMSEATLQCRSQTVDPVDAQTIAGCNSAWAGMVTESVEASKKKSDTIEATMTWMDPFGATTFAEALANVQQTTKCVVRVMELWLSAIRTLSPADAAEEVVKELQKIIGTDGQCNMS